MPATLLIDDQDSQIKYLCPSSHQTVSGSYYNNTWTTAQGDECAKGWFEYTFYGTRVHIGASIAPNAEYSVKLDDGPFTSQPAGDGSFTSSLLTDGKHTITYAAAPGQLPPILDYLTVTTGLSTPLKGRTVVTDDTDSAVEYSDSWSEEMLLRVAFDYSTSFYNHSTHWSRSIGDTIRFAFEGTSISIYGIVANISSGANITAEYTIDGVSMMSALPSDTLDSLPMLELFHADVDAGTHLFTMNITSIQAPQALGIDFVAYNTSTEATSTNDANLKHTRAHLEPWIIAVISLLGTLLLICCFAAIWWMQKRARTQQRKKNTVTHTIAFDSRNSDEPRFEK